MPDEMPMIVAPAVEPFDPTGPLADDHAVVAAWVTPAEPVERRRLVTLATSPSGQALLGADAATARRYLLAAAKQLSHWDRQEQRLRFTPVPGEPFNPRLMIGWDAASGPRHRAAEVVSALMRRTLPLTETDLFDLITMFVSRPYLSTHGTAVAALVRAARRHVERHALSDALREVLRALSAKLRRTDQLDSTRLATTIDLLCASAVDLPADTMPPPARPLVRTATGDPRVHQQLKHALGLRDAPPTAASITTGYDRYAIPDDSPLRAEHERFSTHLAGCLNDTTFNDFELDYSAAGRALLVEGDRTLTDALLAATERLFACILDPRDAVERRLIRSQRVANDAASELAFLDLPIVRTAAFDLILAAASLPDYGRGAEWSDVHRLVKYVQRFAAESPLTDGERYVLHLLRLASIDAPLLGRPEETVRQLTRFIGDRANFWLVPGEAWTDAVNAEIAALPADAQAGWTALFRHALTAASARPSGKWLKTAGGLVDAIGRDVVVAAFERWLPLVSRPNTPRRLDMIVGNAGATGWMNDGNATSLRGLLWIVPTLDAPALTPLLTAVAVNGYRKLPGIGIRAPKVGNAAIHALSRLGTEAAIGQLAILKSRLKGGVQKELDKAFDAAAAKLGLPRDRIEEMAVPSYGLTDVGRGAEAFGECRAEVHVDGSEARLAWFDAKGKPVKSVPAKVKTEHKDDLKALQQSVKDIAAMLPAQRDRIDKLFLARKAWTPAAWRGAYLDHPLVGTIARRLIWLAGGVAVAWHDGAIVDVEDRPVALADDARIELWHPIGRPESEVLAWRAWLARHGVRQPFKQAHREVYLLTDAERRTATYSNRFAAHVLRQHQFNALCGTRGWRNKLRLMVDDTYPPATRLLPQWNLRAEYWIEGIGDAFGTDTAESGAYLRLSTDQVRFHRIEAAKSSAHAAGGGYTVHAAGPGVGNVNEPLPLESIPPLVLSEILRDVDLFVGVASVGNDPTWADGGPGGRYQTYWQHVSFGDLTETAKTRRAVLETLLPRLTKLRGKWSLDEKFLVVRGSIRTYKIHLGSGNILMEPNDQYLCIVADRSTAKGEGVFLPFEGDATLSIILSKAFLLADDARITDATITRQIGR